MKKYKAVVMDFDLTIADTADVIEECLYSHALHFGYDLDRKIIRAGIGMKAADIYRSAGIRDEQQLKVIHDSYDDYATDIMIAKTKFFPGVVEGIAALHEKGVLFAVLSLKVSSHIWTPLKRNGLDEYIHSVIGLGDIEHGKPHPEGIYVLAQRLGVELEDVLYVGDSLTDQQTAEAAGVDFGAVCTGAFGAEDFAKKPFAGIYTDFAALCAELYAALDA